MSADGLVVDLPAGLVAIRGDGAAAVLEFLLVHAEVGASVEADGQIELRLLEPFAGSVPDVGAQVVALAEPAGPVPTGLENDAPIRVSDDLWVRPPWITPSPEMHAGAVEVVVPRGAAFGSGEHESTQAALRLLHACWPDGAEVRVADIGCGSGVLTAYAVVRGAVVVEACDIEGSAVRATRALPPGRSRVVVHHAGPESLRLGPFDVVVANMTWTETEPHVERLRGMVRPGGWLVCSGTEAHEEAIRDETVGRAPELRDREGARWFGAAWRL